MSGAGAYASRLAERIRIIANSSVTTMAFMRLPSTNTFLHKPPLLNTVSPPKEWLSRFDFVISSDVFEHVVPPVSRAFENALHLLKPGGGFCADSALCAHGGNR